LPAIVQTDNLVPKAYKIFREEFTVDIVQKNDSRSKGKTGIAEFKDYILPVGEEKKLKGKHLPKYVGYLFFILYYIEIFVRRYILKISGNNNGYFSRVTYYIKPLGNFVSITFYTG
jgi:hypothetical protein